MATRARILCAAIVIATVAAAGSFWLQVVSASAGGPDAFGYEWIDQDEIGGPVADFVDIEPFGDQLDFRDKQGDVNKDGGFDIVQLKKPFGFYGVENNALLVSTNGYLSTNLNGNGRDLFNACPIPAVPDRDGGARIYPFHDDLVAKHGGFIQHFKLSPVPNISGMREPCTIIMWNDAARSETLFDFEVILFHKSREIRYQYRDLFVDAGDRQTIGIQNEEATIGLNYACDTAGSVSDTSAISFYDTNPELNVVSPDRGIINAGTNLRIRWVSSFPSPCPTVRIVLLLSGDAVMTLTEATPNDGKFKWQIPADLAPGLGYAIHIEDATDGDPMDTSDMSIEVVGP